EAGKQSVAMLNPLSAELSVMRQSLLFSGLESIAHNLNRQLSDLKLFEFGSIYRAMGTEREEEKQLALFLTGNTHEEHWISANNAAGFFGLKAYVDLVLQRLGIHGYTEIPGTEPVFSEQLTRQLNGKSLVTLGLVRTDILSSFEIKQDVLFAEFHWDALLACLSDKEVKYQPIPRYPLVKRDLALLLNEDVTFNSIHQLAFKTERTFLKKVSLFDVYTGKKLPAGKKSYAVSFSLLNEKQTLTDSQIDKVMKKLTQCFESELGAQLR
ncbi:MAG: phenylalanine--tRNA ligase subunit beta, partial [Flavobacteriaceae bacterium]|nr:phenylalanine--tRNA ligase subunit beta [Flavobacteriaceae bacterium]